MIRVISVVALLAVILVTNEIGFCVLAEEVEENDMDVTDDAYFYYNDDFDQNDDDYEAQQKEQEEQQQQWEADQQQQYEEMMLQQQRKQKLMNEQWNTGIALFFFATLIGGASKLAIRKSWLLEHERKQQQLLEQEQNNNEITTNDIHPTTTNSTAAAPRYQETKLHQNKQEQQQQQPICDDAKNNNIDEEDNAYNDTNNAFQYHRYNCDGDDDDDDNIRHNDTNNNSNIGNKVTQTSINAPCSSHNNMNNNNSSDNMIIVYSGEEYEADCTPIPPTTTTIKYYYCCYCFHFSCVLRYIGMIGVGIVNPFLGLLAMQYVSPSIGAPFSGLTMVWILLLSGPLLDEYPTIQQCIAGLLIIIGECFIAIFGDHTNGNNAVMDETYNDISYLIESSNDDRAMHYYNDVDYDSTASTDEMYSSSSAAATAVIQVVYDSYFEIPFLVFIGCMIVWISFLGYWISRPKSFEVAHPTVALFFCWNVPASSIRRFSWGTAGGSLAGLLNFVKDLLIIRQAIKDNTNTDQDADSVDTLSLPSFLGPFRMFLTIIAFSCALGGFYLLVRCMKRYDAPYSATMFVGSYVLSASIMSFIHYDTFQHLNGNVYGYIFYPAGLLILLSGVFLLMMDENVHTVPSKKNTNDATSDVKRIDEGG